MKQRPTRKGKDAEVMGQDSLFAIQRDLYILYNRLASLTGGNIVAPEPLNQSVPVATVDTCVEKTRKYAQVSSGNGVKSATPVKRGRPFNPPALSFIEPDDPDAGDTETAIRYSRLDPLSLVYRNRKVKLTPSTCRLFRYIYDLYQSEGQTVFPFADISEGLTGDDCGLSTRNIDTMKRRLAVSLEKFRPSPLILTVAKEVLYIRSREEVSEQRELDLAAGEEKVNRRGQNIAPSCLNATRGNVASHV